MLLVPLAFAGDADSGAGSSDSWLTPDDDWCGAIAAAAPGAQIDLGPGDFQGPCWIRNAVTVVGHDSRVVYDGASSNVIDVDADDVALVSLAFGPTQADIDAIKIRSGARISVTGCEFVGVGGISVSANSADTEQVHLTSNTFTDLAATGVYLGCHDGSCTSSDYLVADNRFDGVTSTGIGYAIEAKLDSWGQIVGNDIRDAQGPGITVYGSAQGDVTTVEGNVVVASRQAATLEIGGGPALVRNNVVIGGAAGGLYVYDYGDRGLLDDVKVLGNTLWGVGGDAIAWEAGSRLVIQGNAAGRDDGAAALPVETHGADVEGNVDCGDGATCWRDAAGLDLWPLDDGALVDAGVTHDDLARDLCDALRPDPPAAGALEPDPDGVTGFAAYAEDRCPAAGEGGDSEADPTGGAAEGGCGCGGGLDGGAGLVAIAALLARRRSDRLRG